MSKRSDHVEVYKSYNSYIPSTVEGIYDDIKNILFFLMSSGVI